jgi:hypothetical protein
MARLGSRTWDGPSIPRRGRFRQAGRPRRGGRAERPQPQDDHEKRSRPRTGSTLTKVITLGDGKRLEAILVDVAATRAVVMFMPADRMRQRRLAQEGSQLAVGSGPQREMPVRRHKVIAENADGKTFQSLVEYAQEGGVVGGYAKELEPSGGAVQGVVNLAGWCSACAAWHDRSIPGCLVVKRELNASPLFPPLFSRYGGDCSRIATREGSGGAGEGPGDAQGRGEGTGIKGPQHRLRVLDDAPCSKPLARQTLP